jgi:hypothetical protein
MAQRTHGLTGTRLYKVWARMKERCNSPTCTAYEWYGARGISVCAEWNRSFVVFRDWATASGYHDDLTIERVDNNGNYEPSNCTWITKRQQAVNRRSTRMLAAFGETKAVSQWAEDPRCVVSYAVLVWRTRKGMGNEEAITTPTGKARFAS